MMERNICLICKLVLEYRGYKVLPLQAVDTLEELFETLYSFRPDVVLTDHEMPGINGEQIVRMLKRVTQFKHIPVIYFSGVDRIDKLARQTGADDYLAKPLRIDALMGIVTKYTEPDEE